jgi:hypothetical protein
MSTTNVYTVKILKLLARSFREFPDIDSAEAIYLHGDISSSYGGEYEDFVPFGRSLPTFQR